MDCHCVATLFFIYASPFQKEERKQWNVGASGMDHRRIPQNRKHCCSSAHLISLILYNWIQLFASAWLFLSCHMWMKKMTFCAVCWIKPLGVTKLIHQLQCKVDEMAILVSACRYSTDSTHSLSSRQMCGLRFHGSVPPRLRGPRIAGDGRTCTPEIHHTLSLPVSYKEPNSTTAVQWATDAIKSISLGLLSTWWCYCQQERVRALFVLSEKPST